MIRCDGCSSVSAISNTAANWLYEHGGVPGTYDFLVVNPQAKLLGKVTVDREYDPEKPGCHRLGQLNCYMYYAIADTGTIVEMQQNYRRNFPDSGLVSIPTNIANTYTGLNQQSDIGTYLTDYFENSPPVQDSTVLVLFDDNSSAVYQFADAGGDGWVLVHDSGHAPNGGPLDDSGKPISLPQAPNVVLTPSPVTTGGGAALGTRRPLGSSWYGVLSGFPGPLEVCQDVECLANGSSG